MITLKDEVEQFKRDLKSYSYHQKKIKEIDDELLELRTRLEGVSSPAPKDVVLENARNPYASNKLDLIMQEEILLKERSKHQDEVMRVDALMKRIIFQEDTDILIELYVRRFSLDVVARNHYTSRSSLNRRANRIIRKMLLQI